MPVVGWLSTTSPGPMANNLVAFRRGLNETGYVEGQNLAIEYRWAEGQFNRQPALVGDLVGRQVAVIVAVFGIGPARAAKAATSTIPIVFVYGGDPVKHGLVTSLNRPGGNVTGVTSLAEELAGKRVDLLRALVPQAKTVGFLSGPESSILYEEQKNSILEAARALGLEVVIVECRSDRDFEAAFETMAERRADAFILGTFPFSNLLKGAKPADLPVLQPTKFELVINLKTAKALGLDVPATLLALADEVVDDETPRVHHSARRRGMAALRRGRSSRSGCGASECWLRSPRRTRRGRHGSPRSAAGCKTQGGKKAATSKSIIAPPSGTRPARVPTRPSCWH